MAEARYRTVLFDLDGTLADTAPDVHYSMNRLRAEYGLDPIPFELARKSIGPGPDLFVKQLTADGSNSDVQSVIKKFRAIYHEHLLVKTTLFAGIETILQELQKNEIEMAVVTNKPRRFSTAILKGLGIEKFFKTVIGPENVDNLKPAPDPVLKAIEISGVSPETALMVGDTEFDIRAAQSANVDVCAVGYGYTPLEELKDFQPDYCITRPEELLQIVLSHSI